MVRRVLRFSWLATTLLVPLVVLSQASQTPQATTTGQSAAIAQTANPAQPTASAQEAVVPGLKDDLHSHMIDQFISPSFHATAELTCRERCQEELNTCIHLGVPITECDSAYEACLKKC